MSFKRKFKRRREVPDLISNRKSVAANLRKLKFAKALEAWKNSLE